MTTVESADEAFVDVAAIIPTHGRPKLVCRAVQSALDQRPRLREIIVVMDGRDQETSESLATFRDERLEVIIQDPTAGAAAARNLGVRRARSVWVAFLDDDDEWLPGKMAAQWAMVTSEAANAVHGVYSTAVYWCTGSREHVWPLRSIRRGESIPEYLFLRNRAGEGMLPTPAIVVSRASALKHPFPVNSAIHEDWEWLIELGAAGMQVHIDLRPLVRVHAPSQRESLSSSARWNESLAWALERKDALGQPAFAAFCLTEVARRARLRRGMAVFLAVLAASFTGEPRYRDLLRFAAAWFASPLVRLRPRAWPARPTRGARKQC